jgi:hypothetical protein
LSAAKARQQGRCKIAAFNPSHNSLLLGKRAIFEMPAQAVDATQALNLTAGVSNCKVSRGRSFS